jgi:hypothetical protein
MRLHQFLHRLGGLQLRKWDDGEFDLLIRGFASKRLAALSGPPNELELRLLIHFFLQSEMDVLEGYLPKRL